MRQGCTAHSNRRSNGSSAMISVLRQLLDRLSSSDLAATAIIRWGAPVPSFGDASKARVATLGLNPSNREFVDERGRELDGSRRRFHTLRSLGVAQWSAASQEHMQLILESCRDYFSRNPYDIWFKRLDRVLEATRASYYHPGFSACHLDLVPYATSCKWTMLDREERDVLVNAGTDILASVLRDSAVQLLVLNGSAVVRTFQKVSGLALQECVMDAWSLPRRNRDGVPGIAYWGTITQLRDVRLRRRIAVLGYNHNIQSSFGVSNEVICAIGSWIGHKGAEALS